MLCSPCTSKRSDVVEPSPNTLAVDSRRRSLPGNNTGFFDICGEAEEEEAKGESSTTFDKVLDKHKFEAQALATAILERADDISKKKGTGANVARHPEAFAEAHCFPTYVPLGCFVVGHTNTDMDSVASAIGAAHLFGGVACRAETLISFAVGSPDRLRLEPADGVAPPLEQAPRCALGGLMLDELEEG